MKSPRPKILVAALLVAAASISIAAAQVTETNGAVRIEAEAFSSSRTNSVAGMNYSWDVLADTPGYSGSGYIEAAPADGTSAATVTNNWQTASPQVDYSITFSNPGTYYVWVRGYAGDTNTAGLYIGLNGTSPAQARIDMAQYNTWTWANTAAGSGTPVSINIPSAGTYTFNTWMGNSGLDIDRILLTRNPNFSPNQDANFWRDQNIYQIITDRFYNADTSNDVAGLPNFNASSGGQAHGGDFKGIERKLDYIKALGATAIWISPVLKNANGDYHGYAATDFYAVNPRMGTLAELRSLVREAQKRGILVINDVVVNHGGTWVDSGDGGWPNFIYPPGGYSLRYNSGGQQYAPPFDPASISSFYGNSNLANIFHNNGTTQNWTDATQVELGELLSLDDFKTETPYIRQKMREIWTHWIESVGFDAYRLDTVKHVEMGFWDDWSPAIRAAAQAADKPNFFQFGEVFDGSDAKVGSYTGTKTSGVYKMESVLDYPLYYQMGSVFATATGNTGQIEGRYNNLTTANYDATSLDSLVLNLDNHDNPRFLNATGSTAARLELALVFMYTARGIPSLYYGTEQDFNGGADPNNREDMFDGAFEQGPSLGDNFNMTSARFRLIAKLNNLRRLYPALRTGSYHSLWANFGAPGLLAYARRLNGEEAYVVINTATSPQAIGVRPTIHPVGTVLVDALNPANTLTVTAGTDGIPGFTMPATSCRIYIAQNPTRVLAPVVNAITPSHDAASVNPASAITVTFSQSMNTTVTQTAFSTVPSSTGSFSWSANNTVMTYTPSSNLSGNTIYSVRIDSTATDEIGVVMHAPFESRFTTSAAATSARPSINSFAAGAVSDTTASLEATVTPNGAATTVFFEYGTTTGYGQTTSTQSIGSGNSPATVTANLTGLAPGTTYHYRVSASNANGPTVGNDGTFTTSAPLPQVTTTAASFVTATSASINGTVNPNSLPTSIYFEWGDRADNLANTTPVQDVGSGTTNSDRWAELSGLASDTTYFFRMVAVTGTTEVRGATLSFHTLPVKPTVTTLATTNVSVTNAILPGTVNPNGSATVFFFEYGTSSTDFGLTTAAQAAGSGTNAVTLTASVSDLVAGQTYFYRAAASNSFGVSYGAAQSFTAGLPPPSASTLAPANLTTSGAQLRGSVNPNNSYASAWFEWGTNSTNYTFTSRIVSTDNAESYGAFSFASPNNNGGTGFSNFVRFGQSSANSGIYLANNSANQTIDGSKTFGAWAGTAGIAFRRGITNARPYGTLLISARFNVDNATNFAGFNLKSANGSGSGGFGTGELLSFGTAPAAGSYGILVTDGNGQRVLDLGADVLNAIIDFKVDFDAQSRRYVLGAKFRGSGSFVKIDGPMRGSGTNVTHIGFANWNTGNNQDILFDSIDLRGSTPIGRAVNSITVSNSISGLTANRLYHYRVAAMNLDGGITYGENATFYTGIDLTVTATNSGGALVQGGSGQLTVTVSNVGASTTSGTVTVTNQLPAGLTMTSMSGTGWTFNSNNLTATRSTTTAANTSFPAITIGFSVAANAPALLTNTVTVSGGGDGNSLNNTNTFTMAVGVGPDLVIGKTSDGALQQGGSGSFTLLVSNAGGTNTSGSVTVTEAPPVGMTVTSMSGTGWSFNPGNLSVTRSDALAAGASYPPVTVSVAVATNAAALLTNTAGVAGGGDIDNSDNSAQVAVGIAPLVSTLEAWRQTHFGSSANSGAGADTNVIAADGIPNLMKYAMGLNPTNETPAADQPAVSGSASFTITFRRARDANDVTLLVQGTENLGGSWTNIWSSATNAYGGGTNAYETVTITDPVSSDNVSTGRFLRLNVTRP